LRGPGDTWGFILAAALVCGPAIFAGAQSAQSTVAAFQQRFDSDKDPVRRAKLMQQLGVDEFQAIRSDVNQGKLAEAEPILDEYRDQARTCVAALDAKKINASKHSSGFKQLQISLQEALRRLDEIDAGLTSEQQAPFLAVRDDLQRMNDHLVQELFPGPTLNGPATKTSG